MKIHENLKQKDFQTTNFNRMKVSDTLSDLIFKIFTKSFYSNPIGSIVREISSNAQDANFAAGKKDAPIVIRLEDTDMGKQISFIDNGTGMNEEKLKEVYFTLWESDKRQTNDFIGGWGIGSKTPLAYNRYDEESKEYDDSYTVTSICDGRMLSYFIFFDNSTINYSKIEDKQVDMPNGTIVTIPVLDRHVNSFVEEIKKQVCYFNNIIFEGFSSSHSLNNNYKVYDFENFKFSTLSAHDYLHLIIGNVSYPLKSSFFRTTEIDDAMFGNNIALKFDIGELNVTESREEIEYNDESVRLITEKIIEARKEIFNLIYKDVKTSPTIKDWFGLYNSMLVSYTYSFVPKGDDDLDLFISVHLTKEEKTLILERINKDGSKYSTNYYPSLIINDLSATIKYFDRGRIKKRYNADNIIKTNISVYYLNDVISDKKEINKRLRYVKHINKDNNYVLIDFWNKPNYTYKEENYLWIADQIKDYILSIGTDVMTVEKPKTFNVHRKANPRPRKDYIINLYKNDTSNTSFYKTQIDNKEFYFQGEKFIYIEYSDLDFYMKHRRSAFILLDAYKDYNIISIPKYLKKTVELNADECYSYKEFYANNKHKIFEQKVLIDELVNYHYHNLIGNNYQTRSKISLDYNQKSVFRRFSKSYKKNNDLFENYFQMISNGSPDLTYVNQFKSIDEKEFEKLIKSTAKIAERLFKKHKSKVIDIIIAAKELYSLLDEYEINNAHPSNWSEYKNNAHKKILSLIK